MEKTETKGFEISKEETGLSEEEIKELIEGAIKGKEKAYAPYSNFHVGACILTETGEKFSGCNVESASYGLTICAERTAVFKAVSEGFTKFKAISVISDADSFTFPCGACRQVLVEFGDFVVLVLKSDKSVFFTTTYKLLPFHFGPSDLLK
ncbi:cytidine deaminase [Anaeramoeba ignava]|uniref:Cytidine deaminase n=1 Tax=Anaeramoeba ignava TaxID=1746090 RepID=A0A9Q0L9I3_ANAIG|nr:cytidine deaminase [Anaeramoeba ignava]